MDKYIFKKDNALSKYECNNYIEYFESNKNIIKSTENRGYFGVAGFLRSYEFQFLKNILETNIDEYVKQHPFLGALYTPWSIEESFNIQKYLPGMSYKGEHMEHGKDAYDSRRLLGWMLYLNDIKEGGGTCWPQQNFITTPKGGDLYIWPAGWTHSHYGIVAPKEIKYIITGWCSFI